MPEILHITTQGALVRHRGQSLLVFDSNNQQLAEVEIPNLLSVCLWGNVNVSTPAIKTLLRAGVELAYLTLDGVLLGQLTPPRPRNIMLRLAQYATYSSPSNRLEVARKIVASKISSASQLLNYYRRNYPIQMTEFFEKLHQLEQLINSVSTANNLSQLLGIEGTAARLYFSLLTCFIRVTEFAACFKGRQHRPPPDPLNALLSLTYTMLGREILALLDAVGFDPYLGFYHSPRSGRPAFSLDILELFRHSCADVFSLSLVNKHLLKMSHFNTLQNPPAVYLKHDALPIYLQHYESFMRQQRSALGNKTWRQRISDYVSELAKFFNQNLPAEKFPVLVGNLDVESDE